MGVQLSGVTGRKKMLVQLWRLSSVSLFSNENGASGEPRAIVRAYPIMAGPP